MTTRCCNPARTSFLLLLLHFSALSTRALAARNINPQINPGTGPWSYYGCYNETTLMNGTEGLRALFGGISNSLDNMTVGVCLDTCQRGGYMWAGLEYRKECFCAQKIASISTTIPDSSCDLSCLGNSSEFCGGNLRLSVYNSDRSTRGSSALGNRNTDAPMGSILALSVALTVLLCLA